MPQLPHHLSAHFRRLARLLPVAAFTLALAAGCAVEEDGDDCSDSECTTPPAPRCDGTTRITFAATGLCIGDDCRYEAFSEVCEGACEETLGEGSGTPVTAATCVAIEE